MDRTFKLVPFTGITERLEDRVAVIAERGKVVCLLRGALEGYYCIPNLK